MTVLAVTTRLLCCVQVRPEIKLPLLYLIDSIVKNLNGKYLQLFSRNIVRVFCHAFESLVGVNVVVMVTRHTHCGMIFLGGSKDSYIIV